MDRLGDNPHATLDERSHEIGVVVDADCELPTL